MTASMSTMNQCCPITAGSIIIPTETKKMAPNRFLMPDSRCSILSPSTVSARMEPITNAPRAAEKPAAVAKETIPKHRPMDMMRSISSLRYFSAFFRMMGITYSPTRNHKIRKNARRARLQSILPPENCCETARVESRTISSTAMRSSTTRVPKTSGA